MRLHTAFATAILVVAAAFGSAAGAVAQSSTIDRPAELRLGTCANLGDVVVPLANLVFTTGEAQGQLGATPVEQSGTVVPYKLDDLLATDHSVVVLQSPQDTVFVACGEVGGAINPDGTLAIGMRDMSGSGLSGVAYFTPIYEVDSLLITILLVGETSSGDHSPSNETVSGAVVSAQDGIASSDGVEKTGTSEDDGTGGT
jgi:hypothetical protein